MSSIIIFGDSITRGAFDLEKAGWPNRLTTFLWEDNYKKTGFYHMGLDTNILGIDGDLVPDILNRFDWEIKIAEKWGIAKIFFAVGINDSSFENGKKRNNKKDFKFGLEKLIQKGLEKVKARDICFIGLTNIDSNIIQDYFEEKRVAEFDQIIIDTAEANSCQFISMQGLLEKEDLSDGIHPNSNGHEKMFLQIKEFLISNKIL